jgi:hypothetical protein
MRIKLLKKMYRQTNEAMKRGDLFQQRPCPFYDDMHRIFSGIDDFNASSLNSHCQSLTNENDIDDGNDDEVDSCHEVNDKTDILDKYEQQQHHRQQSNEQADDDRIVIDRVEACKSEDTLSHAIDRLIQYQQENEVKHGTTMINERKFLYFSFALFLLRLVGTHISKNKLNLNCNVDKTIERINCNYFNC